jgi:hypothetical protein
MDFPRRIIVLIFQERTFSVMLVMLLQASTKPKDHNNHQLNKHKVAMLRCNPEISPNNNAVGNGSTPWYYR